MIGWFTNIGIVKPLAALAGVLFIAASLFYYQAQSAKARIETLQVENAALTQSLADSRTKHQSLANEVVNAGKRLKAEIESSAAIQRELLIQLDINADLDAEVSQQADLLRQQEREAGNAVRTFDTRGIR